MITEILDYEKIWRKKEKTKQYSTVKREMYLEFLYQIQIGEDIGVDDRKKFQGIICNEDQKRGTRQEHTDTEIALKKGRLSVDHFKSNNTDSQKTADGNRESSQEKECINRTDEIQYCRGLSSDDSLPSSLDAEDYLNKGNTETIPSKTTETINLLRGYRHLKNELKQIPKEERSSYFGILDVEVCIKKCHEILMNCRI